MKTNGLKFIDHNRYNVYHLYQGSQLRSTNLTRTEAIEKIKLRLNRGIDLKDIIIYNSYADDYVSDYFKEEFMDLESTFSFLMFQTHCQLLEKIDDNVYKWSLILNKELSVYNSDDNKKEITLIKTEKYENV